MMEITDVVYERHGRTQFPTLHRCNVCGGFKGMCGTDRHGVWFHTNDKDLTIQVALIMYGYNRKMRENKCISNVNSIPTSCKCECDHIFEWEATGKFTEKYTCTKCGQQSVSIIPMRFLST